ncbi:EAL and HDOD domain-containing protein [Piscinibacter gummiphilus]|uniref:Histidine kinase n=1 Tax=Piscinibacter gummiphilus TaxID=946333 RepID=A0A1W6LBH1_9BURK|nr:HDOD domain-containing protein [Piscinibacter gummiphilus]ARN21593.1 histidine kinase [Piscinibacter gummiphilus]ATU66277.1 HDOD domain-containing protein [Piscinibacter gummiphilus]GLS97866.1 histidine kinase [Piscinibacter gummiphilus]
MNDTNILGQVALGYSPFIDKSRAVSATRLTVFPLRPESPPDVAQLLGAVGNVWPADGGRASLNVLNEGLLGDLMKAEPSPNLMVEVPSFMASDPANVEALQALHKAGNTLLIKGRPVKEVPREVLHCFTYSIVDLSEDRRINETAATAPTNMGRSIPHVQSGVRTLVEMEGSFNRGAAAVLGWPIDDAINESQSKGKAASADLQVIVELIQRVDAQEPIERLEATLKRDPSLAFKLMRYINSPAFGLRVEISSFRHAIMMLGYQRLKRWLALLLSTAGKDSNMKPVMFAAVRRGLLMEELVRSSGDEEMRNEMFICGVFSLLDRMFQQPFSELLKTIPVPERVYQALVDNTGPYQPYFNVVQAVENESLFDFRAAADALMLSVSEINRSVLTALTSASQIE